MHQGEIVHILVNINRKLGLMALNLESLVADFAAEKAVIQSIVSLLTTLFANYNQALSDLAAAIAANDPAATAAAQAIIDNLDGQVKAQTQTLADAVIANTPA
jgi:hypothetical protein